MYIYIYAADPLSEQKKRRRMNEAHLFIHEKNAQHNMWSYFWFRIYLLGKDPFSFTGPEHYAFQVRPSNT